MIIELTKDNLDKYFDDYRKIYQKRFNIDIYPEVIKDQLKTFKIYIYVKNGRVLGLIRFRYLKSNDKYCKALKVKNAIYITNLAALIQNQGIGSYLLNFVMKLAKRTNSCIILKPLNSNTVKYYQRFNFQKIKIDSKELLVLCFNKQSQQKGSEMSESINTIDKEYYELFESQNPFLEDQEILLEDDDESDSDDDTDSDDDSNEDDDSLGNIDVKTKVQLASIKSNIDKLIKLSENMMITNSSEFSDILTQLYKLRYLFVIFVNNYNQYEPKEQTKIIKQFNDVLKQIVNQINKLI